MVPVAECVNAIDPDLYPSQVLNTITSYLFWIRSFCGSVKLPLQNQGSITQSCDFQILSVFKRGTNINGTIESPTPIIIIISPIIWCFFNLFNF